MKRTVEIVLKGKGKLELESQVLDSFGLEVTYNISDIEDVGSRKTNYSKSFKVIGTPKNNKLFEHIYDINFDSNTFDLNAAQPCYVSINGNMVMDGYLKMRSIEKTYIAGKYQIVYTVNIYDEIKDLFTEFSTKNLRDLDFSAPFNFMSESYPKGDHIFDASIIINSQTRLKTHKNVFEYPIINWNYNGINEGENWPTPKCFNMSQFYPSVYVKPVIDKMFSDIGYTYESDFFNGLVMDNFFPRLATIYNDSNMLVDSIDYFKQTCPPGGQSFQYDYGVAQQPGNIPIQPDDDDPSSMVKIKVSTVYTTSAATRTDGGILITGDGDYVIEGEIKMKWLTVMADPSTDRNDRILVKNQDGDVLDEYVFNTLNVDSSIFITFDEPFSLKTGDIIYMWYQCGYIKYEFNYLGNVARWDDYTLTMSIANEDSESKIGTELSLSQFLPNISQSDFLKSLIKQFNLYLYPIQNKEKHVLIEPKRIFYNKGRIIDWTNKVDDVTLTIEPMSKRISKIYQYTMAPIDTLKTKKYFDIWKSNYGNKEIDLNNDSISGSSTIDSLFGGYDFKWYPTNNNADYQLIPNFTKEITDSMATKKREIAPAIGFIGSHSASGLNWGFIFNNVSIVKWNTICHVEKFGSALNKYDLNFETKQGVNGYINSYTTFWNDSMNNLFNNNNRIITYYVNLDIIDIKNLDFKNVILIKGELYYIESVTVDLNSTKPSKLVLIKAFDYLKFVTPEILPIIWGLVETVGVIGSGAGRPIASEALLDTGYKVNQNSESSFILTPDSTLEHYFWFATPNQSLLNKKNSWAVNEYNRGAIGGDVDLGGNLFPEPDILEYQGDSYNVYIANYQTFIDSIKVDVAESTNII